MPNIEIPAVTAGTGPDGTLSVVRRSSRGTTESFLVLTSDGSITAFSGHVDLGTGIRTALAQIVAEELDVAFERVVMSLGDTARTRSRPDDRKRDHSDRCSTDQKRGCPGPPIPGCSRRGALRCASGRTIRRGRTRPLQRKPRRELWRVDRGANIRDRAYRQRRGEIL